MTTTPTPTPTPQVPKAPGATPLLGHALPLARAPFTFLTDLHQHGEIVQVGFGTLPVYFVTTPSLAYEVMVTKSRSFEKGRFFDRLRRLVGDGLATAPPEIHKRHRRIMQPLFTPQRIAQYSTLMSDRAEELAASWQPGQQLALETVMAEFVVSTLAKAMFSTDIGAPAVEAVRRNVPIIIESLLLRTISPAFLDKVPIPANRRFDAAANELHEVLDQVVAATREAGPEDQPDLLSTLLTARDTETGDGLTDAEIRDELGSILFAGTETTATTLAWFFHEIAHAPEVEQKLLAEIDEIVGPDGPVTYDHLPRLPYLHRVIDEVGRLHGVTILMRRATEPVEVGGVELPTGAEVAFSLYAIHRNPDFFKDPDVFDPDRERPRQNFMPFGAGSRKCIGDSFSMTEMAITAATILRRWRLRPDPGHTPKEVTAAMPHPDRLPMTAEPRG